MLDPQVSDQKKWEQSMTALGVSRYRAQQDDAIQGKRFTDTSAGSRLIKVYLDAVSEQIAHDVHNLAASARKRRMYTRLLKGVDYDKLAMFTLHRIIEVVYKPATLTRVAANIGVMVEDELRFSKFEIETPEYFNAVIRDLDARSSTSYTHRHKVLVHRMNDKLITWNSWTNEVHVEVGLLLISAAEKASDLVKRTNKGNQVHVGPSDEVVQWIREHDESIELMLPDRMPCIIRPVEWTAWKTGGFYTNKLRRLTPLVKTKSGQQRDAQMPLLDNAIMPTVYDSVNCMQNTSWRINTGVLEIVQYIWDNALEIGMPRSQPYEIPDAPIPQDKRPVDLVGEAREKFDAWKNEARILHNLEAARKASLMSVVRAMRMAARLKPYNLLWMVYQLDFRGRAYCTTSGVSPQGSDVSKALLKFGESRELGKQGWAWFRVHGANKYGYDKVSYEDRIRWVNENKESFIQAGLDPIGHSNVWKDADKPFQFLAWCMEYSKAARMRNPNEYKSALPIAMDGSCNGLQHFSAMLRDSVGAKSVNLIPSDKPADIYQDVANVATQHLDEILTDPSHEEYTLAANWKGLFNKLSEGKMTRKLTKKPVMTMPYGSTLQTCTQSVHEWYINQKIDHFPANTAFKHSVFLAKLIWGSISEVVIAARAAMKWMQRSARYLAKEGQPIVYYNPIGFPLVQFSSLYSKKRIEAQIGGRVQLQIKKEEPGIDIYKAASGSSPNLVHSIDSSHMHMVVQEGARQGITHFAMIHDDFGVHACEIPKLQKIIRDKFVELHSTCILEDFKNQVEDSTDLELPELPPCGDLDLEQIKRSKFFFG